MSLIDRTKVAAPAPAPRETLNVPELGADVEIRGLMLNEKLRCHAAANNDDGRLDIEQLLAATVYASDGAPLFSKAEWAAWGVETPDRVAAASRMAVVAMKLSGLLPDEVEKK